MQMMPPVIEEQRSVRHQRVLKWRPFVAIVAILIIGIPLLAACSVKRPPPTPKPETPTSATQQNAVRPSQTPLPALVNIPFPSQSVVYPANWPGELRYPAPFVPVEVHALPDSSSGPSLYTTKMRFQGDTQAALSQLSAFFSAAGWQLSRDDLGGNTWNVGLRKNNAQGYFVIEPDPNMPNGTRAIVTISF